MTPKEKAEELFKKYEDCYPKNYDKTGRNFFTDRIKISALIAVDEMMEVYASSLVALGHSTEEAEAVESPYLKEVKQEIEKI